MPESRQRSAETPPDLLASNLELKRRLFDFYTIFELGRSLNSVLDLKSLLNSFLRVLTTQIRVRKTAVFQRQSRQNRIFLLTNWIDVEKFPGRSRFEENSEIIKLLSDKRKIQTSGELMAVTLDKYE
ncbi:MAG: hypothetical protein ACREBV_09435, partial [Candidatus Zixiibacteriota bacterium]